MKDALLHTKLQRPVVAPDFVPRGRLLAQLEQGRHRPLTLISAPAGYGKSTLASRWVASDDSPCGWVSLDEDDNDPLQFLIYLLAAIRTVLPKIHLRTETLLESDSLPPATEVARYLLNDLNPVSDPFTLVLDDYHCITKPAVNDLMAALLAYPAPAMRFMLLTRKDPALPIASWRGSGRVTEIRISDLLFTPTEVAAFMNRMLGISIDIDSAKILNAKTEGWAVGLRLVGLYLRGEGDLNARVRELSGRSGYIADYLFAEVLSRQHPEMVAYLLEASILDRFCAPLCDQMHGNGTNRDPSQPKVEAEQFIQWLQESNLFVIALDDEGGWFRYHHLFREFLNGTLRKQSGKGRIEDLHRLAGNWFAENELIEEAIRHLLAAGKPPDAIQLVLSHRHALMNTSRFVRLSRWLAAFPEDTLAQEPLLVTTRALIGVDLGKNFDLHAFTQKAARMLAGLSPASDRYPELKGEVLVLQSLLELIADDIDSAFYHVRKAFDYLPEDDLMARTVGTLTLSACHQMTGNTKLATAVIKEAVSRPFLPANIKARIQVCLCYVTYLEADLGGVAIAARECLQTIRDLPFTHTRAYANYFHGVALYLQNKLEPAESSLRKVLDDPYSANPTYLAYSGFVLACIYLSHGRESEAVQVLDQLEAHCRENGHTRAMDLIRAFEGEFALRRGDIRKADQICRNVDFDVNQPRWFFYLPQLTHVKYMLAKGTKQALQEAHARLTALDERMHQINRKNVRIEVLALLSIVYHKQGDSTAAMEHLETTLTLAEAGGWIRSFVDLGAPMATLMRHLSEQQPGQSFAQQVYKACQAQLPENQHAKPALKEKQAVHGASLPNPLTRRETEILFLLDEGLSNKKIAEKLFISPGTVKTHLKNIFKKMRAKSRIEALKKARESGIIRRP